MALAAFTRLTDRVLAHLGEPAMLRGEIVDPPIKVNVEHGVELTGVYGEITVSRSVATINRQFAPKVDDILEMLDEDGVTVVARYKLDVLLNNNGYSERFVLLEV